MEETVRHLRECMEEIGLSREEISGAERLFQAGRYDELTKLLRKYRCTLLDEMHVCGRKIDRADLLIRRLEQITLYGKAGQIS